MLTAKALLKFQSEKPRSENKFNGGEILTGHTNPMTKKIITGPTSLMVEKIEIGPLRSNDGDIVPSLTS